LNKISSTINEKYKVSVEGTVMSEDGTEVKGGIFLLEEAARDSFCSAVVS